MVPQQQQLVLRYQGPEQQCGVATSDVPPVVLARCNCSTRCGVCGVCGVWCTRTGDEVWPSSCWHVRQSIDRTSCFCTGNSSSSSCIPTTSNSHHSRAAPPPPSPSAHHLLTGSRRHLWRRWVLHSDQGGCCALASPLVGCCLHTMAVQQVLPCPTLVRSIIVEAVLTASAKLSSSTMHVPHPCV